MDMGVIMVVDLVDTDTVMVDSGVDTVMDTEVTDTATEDMVVDTGMDMVMDTIISVKRRRTKS